MDRRTLLRRASIASAGVVGLAGCGSPDGGEGTEPLETETVGGGETETETEMGTETEMETGTETGAGTEEGTGEATGTEEGVGTEEETGTGTEEGTGTAGGGASAYEFTGVVEAWMGEAPSAISGQENPTLELQAGQQVEVTWTNGDGQPHDFTVQDANGNTLEQSEQLSEEGASTTLTFTASEEMATYVCTIHPSTMVGEISVSA